MKEDGRKLSKVQHVGLASGYWSAFQFHTIEQSHSVVTMLRLDGERSECRRHMGLVRLQWIQHLFFAPPAINHRPGLIVSFPIDATIPVLGFDDKDPINRDHPMVHPGLSAFAIWEEQVIEQMVFATRQHPAECPAHQSFAGLALHAPLSQPTYQQRQGENACKQEEPAEIDQGDE